MQFLPDAADLLAAIARLLDERVLPVVPAEVQHQVRVAGHLAALLSREAELGATAARRERELLRAVLRSDADDPTTALAERLRSGDDGDLERRAWEALVEITRADLAICKPGHDAWEGR